MPDESVGTSVVLEDRSDRLMETMSKCQEPALRWGKKNAKEGAYEKGIVEEWILGYGASKRREDGVNGFVFKHN